MLIICPQCNFKRDVPAEKVAGPSVIAKCPKCHCRFRVSKSGLTEILPEEAREAPHPVSMEEAEEDPRAAAAAAYEREAARFNEPQPVVNPNPWQTAPGEEGWLNAFSQTVLRVMFAAPAFFRRLDPKAALARPLLFYLCLTVFQIVVERLWGEAFASFLSSGAAGDPQMERLLDMLAPKTGFALALLLRAAVMVGELYLFSFLMCMAYRIFVPDKATFPLLFQILAYASAPGVLCVVPGVGSLAAFFWSLGCVAVGCKAALDLDWAKTCFGFLPVILFCAPFLARVGGMFQ